MNRILISCLALVMASCTRPLESSEEEDENELEVEVIGHLYQAPAAPKYVVAVYDSPCSEDALLVRKPIGIDILDGVTAADPSKLFALEAELVDGAQGYLCAWALDTSDAVIGFARLSDQPMAYRVDGPETGAAHDVRIAFGP